MKALKMAVFTIIVLAIVATVILFLSECDNLFLFIGSKFLAVAIGVATARLVRLCVKAGWMKGAIDFMKED